MTTKERRRLRRQLQLPRGTERGYEILDNKSAASYLAGISPHVIEAASRALDEVFDADRKHTRVELQRELYREFDGSKGLALETQKAMGALAVSGVYGDGLCGYGLCKAMIVDTERVTESEEATTSATCTIRHLGETGIILISQAPDADDPAVLRRRSALVRSAEEAVMGAGHIVGAIVPLPAEYQHAQDTARV